MRSKSVILHRAVMAVAVLAVVVVFSGCSSVEPGDDWTESAGRVNGTVRSDVGNLLPEIEVWVWAELGSDAREVCYQTETDENGEYEIDSVEMATAHSFEATYWIGANRNNERTNPIHEDYWAWVGSISVPKGGTCTKDLVIVRVDDGPEEPETYIDG